MKMYFVFMERPRKLTILSVGESKYRKGLVFLPGPGMKKKNEH